MTCSFSFWLPYKLPPFVSFKQLSTASWNNRVSPVIRCVCTSRCVCMYIYWTFRVHLTFPVGVFFYYHWQPRPLYLDSDSAPRVHFPTSHGQSAILPQSISYSCER